jgi:hypothetical protein
MQRIYQKSVRLDAVRRQEGGECAFFVTEDALYGTSGADNPSRMSDGISWPGYGDWEESGIRTSLIRSLLLCEIQQF